MVLRQAAGEACMAGAGCADGRGVEQELDKQPRGGLGVGV